MSRRCNNYNECVGMPLFTYGSLMWSEVLEALLGRVPERHKATIPHCGTLAIPSKPYPVLVPHVAQECEGWMVEGLNAEEWELLDTFENDIYDLILTKALVDGFPKKVFTYGMSAEKAELLGIVKPWDAQMMRDVLPAYVLNVRKFRERFLHERRRTSQN